MKHQNLKTTKPRRRSRKPRTIFIDEPRLLFNYEQATEDPRDGLTLFGPLERGKPYGVRFAVVGTPDGIGRFRGWLERIQLPIGDPTDRGRPPFPGFEAAFGIPWRPNPQFELAIDERELHRRINFEDKHHRVYSAVDLYEDAILRTAASEESPVDVWFVVVPDEVYRTRCTSAGEVAPAAIFIRPSVSRCRITALIARWANVRSVGDDELTGVARSKALLEDRVVHPFAFTFGTLDQ